ncbi:MAG: outer membrane protein [Cyclobacteriaceae bacterium]|jgi:outer membrane protein
MKKQLILVIASFLIIIPFQSKGQGSDVIGMVLTMEEVVSRTLANNFQLNVSRNRLEISINDQSPGNAGMLPVVTANGAYNGSIQDTEQEFADGRIQERSGAQRTVYSTGLNMSWTIFDGTRMFATLDRLENETAGSQLVLRQQIDNTLSQVISLFYLVGLEQERLSLFEKNVSFSEQRLAIVEAKYLVGKASKLALLQAKVDLNTDRSSLIQQKELLTTQKLELARLMGGELNDFSLLYEIAINENLQLELLLEKSQVNNPSIQIQKTTESVVKNQFQEINRGRLPVVGVNMGYGYSNLESEAGFLFRNQTLDFGYGVTASVNLFNGFNQRRLLQNTQILMENAHLLTEEAKVHVRTELLSAFTSYENNLERRGLESENLSVADENASIALERFKLGASDALELREAQINAVNAQVRYLTALYNAKFAEIELNRLAGTVTDYDE